jgi:hypothetical protein
LALYLELDMHTGAVLSAARNISMLGVHNGFLLEPPHKRHQVWRDADGYLFKTYESPVVRVPPGWSNDTRLVPRSTFVQGRWLDDAALAEAWQAD